MKKSCIIIFRHFSLFMVLFFRVTLKTIYFLLVYMTLNLMVFILLKKSITRTVQYKPKLCMLIKRKVINSLNRTMQVNGLRTSFNWPGLHLIGERFHVFEKKILIVHQLDTQRNFNITKKWKKVLCFVNLVIVVGKCG